MGGELNRKVVGPRVSAKVMARVAVMGALSAALFAWPRIPMPVTFLQLDFSTLPVLLIGFAMGPLPSIMVALVKDAIGLTYSSSAGVGELADFLCTMAFVLPAVLVYRRVHTRKGALIGIAVGIPSIVLVGALSNYYLLVPFYTGAYHMTMDGFVDFVRQQVPAVDSIGKFITLIIVPFNLIKGMVLGVLTVLMYKRISPLLKP